MLRFLLPRHVESEERAHPRVLPGGCAELVPAAGQHHHLPHPGQPQPGRGEGDRPPPGRQPLSCRGSRHNPLPPAVSQEQTYHHVIIIIIIVLLTYTACVYTLVLLCFNKIYKLYETGCLVTYFNLLK